MQDLIDHANAARLAGAPDDRLEARIGAGHRLFAYGTLRPGEPNHRVLRPFEAGGRWIAAEAPGRVRHLSTGPNAGLPAFRFGRGRARGRLLISPALPRGWPRLDTFEGPDYPRLLALVATAEGEMAAYLYEYRGAEAGALD